MCTLSTLIVFGCAIPTKSRIEADKETYTAVSFTSAAFKPAVGDAIAWYGPPVWGDPGLQKTGADFSLQLQDAVARQLVNRGYKLVDERGSADYLIGIGLITGDGENSEAITGFFRVFPQLSRSAAGFDKGVIVAGIIAAQDRKAVGSAPEAEALLWRSGVEAFVLALPAKSAEQTERVTMLAEALMKSVPGTVY